jgi:hypothetical protein
LTLADARLPRGPIAASVRCRFGSLPLRFVADWPFGCIGRSNASRPRAPQERRAHILFLASIFEKPFEAYSEGIAFARHPGFY